MDKSYCKKIDQDLLVEKYVEGKLDPKERKKFEQHISECAVHAYAVNLEKALHRGIAEFARAEIRTRLKRSIDKQEDLRFFILRYAAIFFLVVLTPLILYYQFYMPRYDEDQISDRTMISEMPETIEKEAPASPAIVRKPQTGDQVNTTGTASPSVSGASGHVNLQKEHKQPIPPAKDAANEKITYPAESDAEIRLPEAPRELEPEPIAPDINLHKRSAESAASGRSLQGLKVIRQMAEPLNDMETNLKFCIQNHRERLKINPYTLHYSFMIDSSGRARDIRLQAASESLATLDSCLISEIRSRHFEIKNEETIINRELTVPIGDEPKP